MERPANRTVRYVFFKLFDHATLEQIAPDLGELDVGLMRLRGEENEIFDGPDIFADFVGFGPVRPYATPRCCFGFGVIVDRMECRNSFLIPFSFKIRGTRSRNSVFLCASAGCRLNQRFNSLILLLKPMG